MLAKRITFGIALALALAMAPSTGWSKTFIQCPGDELDVAGDGGVIDSVKPADVFTEVDCAHMVGADGFITMADGRELYMFGFADVTGVPEDDVINAGLSAANFAAPTLVMKENQEFYLNLTNVGMPYRPDLFDPHTIHYHGFPNASVIYDGLPETAVGINQGATLTYFYKNREPGTYMWHCHVEATEHMQMGMLGSLYVMPAQNELPDGTALGGHVHSTGDHYVYNDGDGSTYYDVEVALQLGSFDGEFHQASEDTQPLPFAEMLDTYGMINGRGYPDTTAAGPMAPPTRSGAFGNPDVPSSQPIDSVVAATAGDLLLLRLSNLNVTNFYTVTALGLPMKVVGEGAKLLRGPTGIDASFETASVTLGGGQSTEVIIDTSSVTPGTYYLYTTNAHYLANDQEAFGGIMTEITIAP